MGNYNKIHSLPFWVWGSMDFSGDMKLSQICTEIQATTCRLLIARYALQNSSSERFEHQWEFEQTLEFEG